MSFESENGQHDSKELGVSRVDEWNVVRRDSRFANFFIFWIEGRNVADVTTVVYAMTVVDAMTVGDVMTVEDVMIGVPEISVLDLEAVMDEMGAVKEMVEDSEIVILKVIGDGGRKSLEQNNYFSRSLPFTV